MTESNTHDARILLFVRYPEPGSVKTRLARHAGNDKAAELYRAFVEDTVEGLKTLPVGLTVCYAPELEDGSDAGGPVTDWLLPLVEEKDGVLFMPQRGADLGSRMLNAFEDAFAAGADRVALMGSDIPDFPPALVLRAIQEVDRTGCIIGPSQDGGYYLLAFTREEFAPMVFHGPRWGESDVLRTTLELVGRAGLLPALLPEWNDVDTFRDLNVLWRINKNSSFRHSRTWPLLKEMEEELRKFDVESPYSLDEDAQV